MTHLKRMMTTMLTWMMTSCWIVGCLVLCGFLRFRILNRRTSQHLVLSNPLGEIWGFFLGFCVG
ncbi:hypothetical protein Hanom_Chr03g00271281 [Helianthus anomalus]